MVVYGWEKEDGDGGWGGREEKSGRDEAGGAGTK
jgi:hypothetical protein